MMMGSRQLAFVCLAVAVCAAPAMSQWGDVKPEELAEEFRGMQIIENLNGQLPLDLEFQDASGQTVTLSKYFDGKRPVVIALIYYRCPMLCGLMTQGLVEGVKELSWTPGNQYRLVVVSFDHTETPKMSDLKQRSFLAEVNRPGAEKGVAFLTGSQKNIKQLAGVIGFPFKWSDESEQYSHPSAIYVATPRGKIARYLHGVNYPEKNLRLSLVEASDGKVGSFADRVLLLCSHFDASQRGYVTSALKVMNLAGGTFGMGILAVLFLVVIRRRMKKRNSGGSDHTPTPPSNAPAVHA